MQSEKTTPMQEESNLVKIFQKIAKDKTPYTIQCEMSDLAFQEFHGFNQEIFSVPISEMILFQKSLDIPLSFFSKFGASLLGIKTKHEFLLFETTRFLMTIDFYEGNQIRIRVGDRLNVFEIGKQNPRKNSSIVKTSEGLEWKRHFKEGSFLVQDVFAYLKKNQLEKGFSRVGFNGSHFSRKFWNDILEATKNKE